MVIKAVVGTWEAEGEPCESTYAAWKGPHFKGSDAIAENRKRSLVLL